GTGWPSSGPGGFRTGAAGFLSVPVRHGVACDPPEPGSELPARRVELELGKARNQSQEDVLHDIGDVTCANSVPAHECADHWLIYAHELGPGNYIGSIADPLEELNLW